MGIAGSGPAGCISIAGCLVVGVIAIVVSIINGSFFTGSNAAPTFAELAAEVGIYEEITYPAVSIKREEIPSESLKAQFFGIKEDDVKVVTFSVLTEGGYEEVHVPESMVDFDNGDDESTAVFNFKDEDSESDTVTITVSSEEYDRIFDN